MERIINKLIDDAVANVDTYKTDGSTWLIFTETKKWVIELTKDGTLWYNYNFFKDLLVYLSMDVVENQHYITKWVEDNVINKVKRTLDLELRNQLNVENTIQNGVKETNSGRDVVDKFIIDTLENGVKDTLFGVDPDEGRVEDTIENGVKETIDLEMDDEEVVEYFIENGVKETTPSGYLGSIEMKGEIVHQFESPKQNNEVEDTIQNGVKETLNTAYMPQEMVEETIENGIKETKTPGKDGNIKSTLEWVSKNGTFSVRELIDGVIENGVKHTIADEFGDLLTVEDTIQNGVKDTKTSMSYQTFSVEDTIQNGVKETNPTNFAAVDEAIQNGVKDTKLGAPNNRDYFIKDTIENGVKLTNSSLQIDGSCVIENVIKEGVKYTGGIGNPNWMGNKVEDAVKNGVKHTCFAMERNQQHVDDTIQKGIKNTYSDILPKEYDWSDQFDVQEVIDNGVKHTEYGDWEDGDERLDDIIRNGVKETLSSVYPIERVVEKVVEVGVLETKSMDEWVNTDNIVNKVMNNGIKEVQPLPAQDGNRDWGNYYYRKGEPTKPHTKYVDDVLEKGEKI
jgi:hypothetical protein